jgi:8-oxo-dGTP diphosphatase
MSDRPKVGVSVIIYNNGKILLGKRKGSHGANTWAFPGGHLEYGESWKNCAKREVLEETNLDIKGLSYFHVTNDVFEWENKHYITIYLVAYYSSGLLKTMEPDKCEGWKWIGKDELENIIWERPEELFLPLENLFKDIDINDLEVV